MTIVLILALIAGIFWLGMLLWPAQRRDAVFVYNAGDSPRKFDREFPTADGWGDAEPAQWPSVTVIVPGRNEGHLLKHTLGSLCALDYPNFKVVFIDDQSTDNTAAICRELETAFPHLAVIHNTRPPESGWVGKSWAIHQAESHMQDPSCEFLLFTDSDLEYHRACLKQMMRLAARRRADLVSIIPRLVYKSSGEMLGLLPAMTLITLRFPLAVCNDPKKSDALVAGGFLLIRRTAYETIGGHAGVRGQMVEDVALGNRAKARGLRGFSSLTQDLYSARMYEGLADTFRGLKKNAYVGAQYNPLAIVPTVLMFVLLGILPPVYAAAGIFCWITSPGLLTMASAAAGIAAFALMLSHARKVATLLAFPPWTAVTLPAGFVFYTLIFLSAAIDHHLRGPTWSGRTISRKEVRSLHESRNT